MTDKVKFPTEVPDVSPASNDRIIFSDTSNANALADCTLDALPISTAQAAVNATKLESVVAGTNITVDNTDPLNPIISSA